MKNLKEELEKEFQEICRKRLIGEKCSVLKSIDNIAYFKKNGTHIVVDVEFNFISELVFGTWDDDSYDIKSYELILIASKILKDGTTSSTTSRFNYEL